MSERSERTAGALLAVFVLFTTIVIVAVGLILGTAWLVSSPDSKSNVDYKAERRQEAMEEERAKRARDLEVEVKAREIDAKKHPGQYPSRP
jgi:hypothetical protein